MDELMELRRRKMKELMEKQKKRAGEVMDKPVDLTDENLNDVVGKHPLVVVDCWAQWCGPCHMIAPVIDELAGDYAGKIVFGKVNVDENRGVAEQYGVMSIPTLLVFKNGKLVDQIVGALPRQSLEPKITKHLE
jgi:thioredoxin 1